MAVSPLPTDHPGHKHLVAHLRERMSDESQTHAFAGWRIGIEFDLWEAIHGGSRDLGGFTEISDEELAELSKLSDLVGGWHMYDRFVPIVEWRLIAASKPDRQELWRALENSLRKPPRG